MKCLVCHERTCESGFDECKTCLIELVENDPVQLEAFFDKPEILKWISEVHAERNRVLGRALGDGFMQKRQAQ